MAKEPHSSQSSCTGLFIQPQHSSAHMCQGEAAAAAPPAPGANHDLPAAAWAGHWSSGTFHTAWGREPGWDTRERCLWHRSSPAVPAARLARGALRHHQEPRHARGTAATRLGGGDTGLSRPWDGARGNRAAGKAPAASCSPVEESPAWLGGCHGQPSSCPSSQGCSHLAIPMDVPPIPHSGSPQGGQCPPGTPEGHCHAIPSRHHVAFCCREEHLARCCPAAQE